MKMHASTVEIVNFSGDTPERQQ